MAEVAEEFRKAEKQRHGASGHTAKGDDEREPTAVGVGAFTCDASEDGEHKAYRDCPYQEYGEAGGEKFAGVGLHRNSGC